MHFISAQHMALQQQKPVHRAASFGKSRNTQEESAAAFLGFVAPLVPVRVAAKGTGMQKVKAVQHNEKIIAKSAIKLAKAHDSPSSVAAREVGARQPAVSSKKLAKKGKSVLLNAPNRHPSGKQKAPDHMVKSVMSEMTLTENKANHGGLSKTKFRGPQHGHGEFPATDASNFATPHKVGAAVVMRASIPPESAAIAKAHLPENTPKSKKAKAKMGGINQRLQAVREGAGSGIEPKLRDVVAQEKTQAPPAHGHIKGRGAVVMRAKYASAVLSGVSGAQALRISDARRGQMKDKDITTLDAPFGSGAASVIPLNNAQSQVLQLATPAPPNPTGVEQARLLAAQIARSVSIGDGRLTEISLNPAELGKVRMKLHTTELGVQLNISTDRPEVSDLLRRHIGGLVAEFHDMGFKNIGFTFSDSGHSPSGQNRTPDRIKLLDSDGVVDAHMARVGAVPKGVSVPSVTDGLDLRL